jgi:hypothetical protein
MKTFKQGFQYGTTLIYMSPAIGVVYVMVQFYNWTS